jgi:2-oxoglutarate dehydrogenase E1 component
MSIQDQIATSQLSGGNAAFVEELYEAYLGDPAAVSTQWRAYFAGLGGQTDVAHAPVLARIGALSKQNVAKALAPAAGTTAAGGMSDAQAAKQAAVLRVINSHRTRGHLRAQIDPLAMMRQPEVPDLALEYHGFSAHDLNQEFDAPILVGKTRRTLADTLTMLKSAYLGSIGAEYMHIPDYDQRRWFQERMESTAGQYGFDAAKKKRILERLTAAEGLERYLHTKYVGQKRFSLEGGDSMIPLMDELVQRAGSVGVKDVVVGMAHRGRLNVLINTVGKPPRSLFDAFEGKHDHVDDPAYSGDVKYHLGFSSDVKTSGGTVHVALGFNPSHLEIINPVVTGSVRARQTRRLDSERSKVVPILIHGDAAFAGQGVVPELLNMSQARGYAVGGTIHIVVNNQVGFTTSRPDDARSTFYCTDVAKMINAPVLHVNGDDPEAVVFCAQLAFDYRQQFKRDVVIDLVCYRRHGHNEADEPAATQPLMYQVIRARKTTRELYAVALTNAGVISASEPLALQEAYRAALEKGLPVAPELTTADEDGKATDWRPYIAGDLAQEVDTGGKQDTLVALATTLNTLPAGLTLHPRVAKVYDDRAKMTAGSLRMDWGYAETLAYATLLKEGFELRLSGQDVGRGTFFHRHAVLHDQPSGKVHIPLAHIAAAQSASSAGSAVEIIDSVLSEEAVMAFEYGFATAEPRTLVIWEAQFGDFCNGAQVVIDQFLSSGEAKWGRGCGLVLFLPHGFEGQGPEHSSARLERFLQLCALNNMQVCTPTTPAQMFHMLRRQMLRNVRKPLVVMTPKSMLRNKSSTSDMADLAGGKFWNMIPDTLAKNQFTAQRLVLCAGKVYYDLLEEAEKRGLSTVALVRVEQLYPFPRSEVTAELARFPNAKDIIWCQEEPLNQGAWFQVRHHLEACLSAQHLLRYAGRDRAAAPACGHSDQHIAEQTALVNSALVG